MTLTPDWERDGIALYCGDVLDVLSQMDDGSVPFVYADPPYNIGKAAWDKVPDYLAWCEMWIAECSRVLAANGAFWISHSVPEVLVDLSRLVAGHGRKRINWITWDKYNGAPSSALWAMNKSKINPKSKRSWDQDAEFLVYHADDGEWDRACGKLWSGELEARRGFIFEPLRAYLDGERERAGFTVRRVAEEFQKRTGSRTVTGMAGHWFGRSQWELPTRENHSWLQRLFNASGGDYLRREYDDLRREYEHLRYTFHNPGKMSSVWQIAPARANGHPTPKPEALLTRMIEATTNPGDLCLAPFAGSFTTGVVAAKTSRRAIGIDTDPAYCDLGAARCSAALADKAEQLNFVGATT